MCTPTLNVSSVCQLMLLCICFDDVSGQVLYLGLGGGGRSHLLKLYDHKKTVFQLCCHLILLKFIIIIIYSCSITSIICRGL
jgi:hypothetical protein